MINTDQEAVGKATQSTTGISYTNGPDKVKVGSDKNGRDIYADKDKVNSNDPQAGANYIESLKKTLMPFGVLSDEKASALDKIQGVASDLGTYARLTEAVRNKDAKAFGEILLGSYGHKIADISFTDPKNKAGANAAISSYFLFSHWDTMSTAQKTLGIANTGVQASEYFTGENLAKTPIGDTGLTVGQGLGLAGAGLNAYSLAKNWKQLDTLGKIVHGGGTVAETAQLAKSMGLIGTGTHGANVANATPENIAALGGTPAPAFGVGAIHVEVGGTVPAGYKTIASADGQQVAIPVGNENSAAVAPNSFSTGVAIAGTAAGAYAVQQNWGKGGEQGAIGGAVGGSAIASGLSNMGESNPYLLGGIVAASVLGGTMKNGVGSKVLEAGTLGATAYGAAEGLGYVGTQAAADAGASSTGSAIGGGATIALGAYKGAKVLLGDGTNKEKAVTLRRTAEDTAASYYTFGLSSLAQAADAKFLGGKGEKLREKAEILNPMNKVNDKIVEIGLNQIGSKKDQGQVKRDMVRQGLKKSGIVDDKYGISLVDGSTGNVGVDGHGEEVDARYADKLVDAHKGKKLHSYDVDYTNDMDYFSGMGGISLTRLLAGGASTAVDQMGSQLANQMLGKVGRGADMSPENFATVMGNQKGAYAKAGINSKEDAYQLANVMLHDGKIDESTHASMLQSFNMVFDGDINTANKLSAGRFKGVQAVAPAPVAAPIVSAAGIAEAAATPGSKLNTPGSRVATGDKATQQAAANGITAKGMSAAANAIAAKGKPLLTKEDAIAANKAKYAQGVPA